MSGNTEVIAGRIGAFATGLVADDIPPEAARQAKLAMIDTVGVSLAAAGSPAVGPPLRAFEAAVGGDGACTVLGSRRQRPPVLAALVNGTLAHGLDYDDRGHSSTHGLAAALAVGELQGSTGREALTAFVVNREVRMALDLAIDAGREQGRGPGSRGWHGTGSHGVVATAATAARLLGLDAEQATTAAAIAVSSPGGLMANFGTLTKPLHAGQAAASGVTAALLAREGWTANPAAFEDRGGFIEALCRPGEVDADEVCAALGEKWDILDRGVRIKPHPSCTASHPAIDAALALRDELPAPFEEVAEVRVNLREFFLRYPVPANGIQAKFSMPYCVSVAFLDGRVEEHHFSAFEEHLPRVRHLLDRFSGEPARTDLTLVWPDGTEASRDLAVPRNLTTEDEVERKFLANAEAVLSPAEATAALQVLRHVEELDRLDELSQALRPAL